jgi:carbamoyltransferase
MRILGINCLNHDAAVSVIENGKILFAGHSERYSRQKNDMNLNDEIMQEALSFGKPDKIAYYERPWIKKTRQLYAGQYNEVFTLNNLPGRYLKPWLHDSKIEYVDHHRSHAAAGYYTSPYHEAAILVIDGIGEWDVLTIWHGKGNNIKKIYSIKYPHSLGLFYSAATQAIDLKPCEEEYILMGMSGWGKDKYWKQMKKDIFNSNKLLKLNYNLHKGLGEYGKKWDRFDMAASTQTLTEIVLFDIVKKCKTLLPNVPNLVYMGGCALNCVANGKILPKFYKNTWIMPNPGDAGSSLGAAASLYGKHIEWKGPFLGTSIEGEYPVKKALKLLLKGNIIGIANGRAEFGPRALGNRSLLADPRGSEIKDKVNEIKRRQKFRPFAPAIMEEYASEIFDMPVERVPYMQYTATCKYPEKYPAICHVDNTSRVQTVSKTDNPGFYALLKAFYNETGCPMLLNTSLNIKGQPIVNNEHHAKEFENHYNVKVLS